MADKIHIDVLTLDSVQCAACGYMMESIAALPGDVQEMIEYTEWSIKNKDGIGKFLELKGRVLPTICIERDLVFESIIPQYEELIDEMAARAPSDKMRERIKALRVRHGCRPFLDRNFLRFSRARLRCARTELFRIPRISEISVCRTSPRKYRRGGSRSCSSARGACTACGIPTGS